ncbi:MAG: pentapeptide repeat-containing protein, partial [Gammaproteobacteria bacterium]
YADQFAKRTDPEESYKYLINTQDLLPLGVGCAIDEIVDDFGMGLEVSNYDLNMRYSETQMEASEQEAEKAATLVREQGENLDPASRAKLEARLDKPEAPRNPDVDRFKEIAEKIAPGAITDPRNIDISKIDLKAFDELRAFSDEVQEREKNNARAELKNAIDQLDQIGEEGEGAREKLRRVMEEIDMPPKLPRVELGDSMIKMRESLAQVENERERLKSLGATDEQLKRFDFRLDEVEAQIRQAQKQARKAYRDGAHFTGPYRSPHAGEEPAITAKLEGRLAQGLPVSEGDYAFCDLRGLDLRGADLSNSYMEYADLRGVDLTGTKLQGCILVHARLEGAVFRNADLSEANLGGSDFSGTRFEHCQAIGTRFARGLLIGTRFEDCLFTDCQDAFLECEADALHMTDCTLRAQNFIEISIANSQFKRCDLSECNWVKPILAACRFEDCRLESTTFVEATITKGHFERCEMRNARFVGGCQMTDASFAGSVLDTGNLMNCDLHSARFSEASLNETVFNGSDLSTAQFDAVVARRAMFNSCELQGAALPKADFFEASFYKARMLKADFRGSNLYGANLMEVTLGETRFQGANLQQTILKDWRPLT